MVINQTGGGMKKINWKWDRVEGTPQDPDERKRMEANKATFKSSLFVSACTTAGIAPTERQASKWNLKKGIAYKIGIRQRMDGT